MGSLREGQWVRGSVAGDSDDGAFVRRPTTLRHWISAEPDAAFAVESGRYHLYVSFACPWAHRTLIARELCGLQDAISVTVVDPHMGEDGWAFSDGPGCSPDPVFGARFLRDVYVRSHPKYTGNVTVPVLLDKQSETIVNNESRDILRMMSTVLRPLGRASHDLCPADKLEVIDATIDANYEPINNGVYKAGFARSQRHYDAAIDELFAALGRNEGRLQESRFLCGDELTEADICLFTTLLRFDTVYHTHFKCNVRRVADHPALSGFLRDVYQTPGVAHTCNFDHIKRHYYGSHPEVNPSGVVARGPDLRLDRPHDRG